ncbi:MAG: hypothetical protein ABIF19_11110 [Planctomycetota bacterium]
MDSSLNGYETNNGRNGKTGRRLLVWTLAIGAALLVSSGPAFGQFTVQPMKLDLQVTVGKQVESAIEIQNIDPNQAHTIDFSLTELTQGEDGSWEIIGPNDISDPNSPFFGFDMSKLSSCSKWVTLGKDSVTVAPLQVAPVPITVRVPRGQRGFFCAGILASIRPRPEVSDVALILQFLVPVIIEIQGRPMRSRVEATEVGMEYFPAQGTRPATTLLSMRIANNGLTFPRLNPVSRVWIFTEGHWKVLATTAFQDIGIIPGAKLNIKTNLNKSLPSGKYKVAGVLYVDGQRTKRVEKVVDFVGDATVTRAAADAPLDLFPADVEIENLPGAKRTTMIKVYNGADETVNVRLGMGLPADIQSAVYQGVKGVDLDCSRWLTIEPQQFTLRGEGGMQNISITSAMPENATEYPCYYSVLGLWATYPDGQNAGVSTAKIAVQNKNLQASPAARATRLVPSALSESKYLIAANFFNSGIAQFTPVKCKAAVTTGTDTIPRASTLLSSTERGLMLPFENRNFSGVLDFANLPAETYRLSVALEYAPGVWATKQIAIRVNIEGDRRVIDVVGTEEELPEIIEIQWSNVPASRFFAKE